MTDDHQITQSNQAGPPENSNDKIYDLLTSILGDKTLPMVLEAWFQGKEKLEAQKTEREKIQIESHKETRAALLQKYKMDIILTVTVLFSIGGMAYFQLLDTCTTGTLVGAAIGYAFGRIRGTNGSK